MVMIVWASTCLRSIGTTNIILRSITHGAAVSAQDSQKHQSIIQIYNCYEGTICILQLWLFQMRPSSCPNLSTYTHQASTTTHHHQQKKMLIYVSSINSLYNERGIQLLQCSLELTHMYQSSSDTTKLKDKVFRLSKQKETVLISQYSVAIM